MARRSCDGAGLLGALRSGVANLEAHVERINALNVYPVPDGDTGSNMLATVRAALDEAERVPHPTAHRIAAAASVGALMGARGNSGVITSQIFRGMAGGLEARTRFNGLDLAHALNLGTAAAYAAVVRPVEGTILTVLRDAAAAAVETAERTNDLEAVLAAAVDEAGRSVARTPTLLPLLRESGVVDAGGEGLYRLFQGGLQYLVGSTTAASARRPVDGPRPSVLVAHADDGFGYETMFLLRPRAGEALDVDAIRASLESIGTSVLVAGDSRAVKVHVHSEHPDAAVAYGLGLGSLSGISVENLDAQARDMRQRRAAASPAEQAPTSPPSRAARLMGVVAVATGDGLAACFRSFGVSAVVSGGQASNPSTGELLAAIDGVDAEAILLLPNNPNVLMAAQQVAALSRRPVHVVPTRNAAEGLAAVVALDPSRDPHANAEAMTRAARGAQTLQVTEAIRDARVGERHVRRGQTMVLGPDEGLVAVDADRTKAILAGIDSFASGFELVTVYYGLGADLAEAEALARSIGEHRSGLDIELVHGGQPHYRYLIAAE